MTSIDFARVRFVFEAVVDLPVSARGSALDRLCGGDEATRAEVIELLDAHAASDEFLDPVATPDLGGAGVGTTVGAYRIESELAAGGMGIVYEATQAKPARRVALKMMRLDLSSSGLRRRFEFEAEVLGRLQHPGIAQIHDAGVFRNQQGVDVPYFAMEFVDGAKTIVEYAEDRRLDVRARVALLADVCDAIHHGHQKGVIHRDVKPSNVLVGSDGRPKVIDFGIARATDRDGAATLTLGHVVGTLQYMSPEQLSGEPDAVDVRADVYGLGALLYELLCGEPPHAVAGKSITDVAHIIAEEVPARPSARAQRIPPELDWIALKALEKEPSRRYGSAAEMRADLRRHLADEVVSAARPSALYRGRKFVRRNRLVVASASAVVAALVIGLVVAASQMLEKRREVRFSNAINRYLDRWLSSADPDVVGRDVKITELLFEAERELDASLGEEPEVRAALRHTLGKSLGALGEYDRAIAHLERALDTRSALLGGSDRRTLDTQVELFVMLGNAGRIEDAARRGRATVERCRACLGAHDALSLSAGARLGSVLTKLGQHDEGRRLLEDALAHQRERLGARHTDTLASMTALVELYRIVGAFADAEAPARETRQALRDTVGPEHSATLAATRNLAAVLAGQGRYSEAATLHEGAYAIYEKRFGGRHRLTLLARGALADMRSRCGETDVAIAMMKEIVGAQSTVRGDDDLDTITTLNNLGVALNEARRFAEAESYLRRALEAVERRFGDADGRYATTLGNLALSLKGQRKLDEAESTYRRALALARTHHGDAHPDTLAVMHNLSVVLVARRKAPEAVRVGREALRLRRAVLGESHPRTLRTMHALVGALRKAGPLDEALALARQSAEAHRRECGPEGPATHHAVYRLGLVLRQARKFDEAVAVFGELLTVDEAQFGREHQETLETRYMLGRCLVALQRFDDAERELLAVFEVVRRTRGPSDRFTRSAARALVDLYEKRGEPERGAAYRALASR